MDRLEDMALSLHPTNSSSASRDQHLDELARLNNIRARSALTEQFTLLMKATERKGASAEDLEWLRAMKRQVQMDMHGLLSTSSSAAAGASDAGASVSMAAGACDQSSITDADDSAVDLEHELGIH